MSRRENHSADFRQLYISFRCSFIRDLQLSLTLSLSFYSIRVIYNLWQCQRENFTTRSARRIYCQLLDFVPGKNQGSFLKDVYARKRSPLLSSSAYSCHFTGGREEEGSYLYICMYSTVYIHRYSYILDGYHHWQFSNLRMKPRRIVRNSTKSKTLKYSSHTRYKSFNKDDKTIIELPRWREKMLFASRDLFAVEG